MPGHSQWGQGMVNLQGQDIEKLVELITAEVMAALQDESTDVTHIVNAGASRLGVRHGRATTMAAEVAGMIDHTILKPEATESDIRQLCAEARQFSFASVCINPTWVRLCAEELRGTPVLVCTVVGFPLGATLPEVKAYETEHASANGAQEIDMVINIGALKSGDYALVERDIMGVVNAAHARGATVKVIIEAALLDRQEKITACTLAKAAGADYVKTSTGFGPGGATVEDVALMRQVVGGQMGVKAAGGVRTLEDARNLISAGATRIGASAGVKIVREAEASAS